MEATAKATYVRISPRKVQIVLDLIRNQPATATQLQVLLLREFRQEHRAELTESIREHHTSQLPLRNWKTKRGGKLNGTEM